MMTVITMIMTMTSAYYLPGNNPPLCEGACACAHFVGKNTEAQRD